VDWRGLLRANVQPARQMLRKPKPPELHGRGERRAPVSASGSHRAASDSVVDRKNTTAPMMATMRL